MNVSAERKNTNTEASSLKEYRFLFTPDGFDPDFPPTPEGDTNARRFREQPHRFAQVRRAVAEIAPERHARLDRRGTFLPALFRSHAVHPTMPACGFARPARGACAAESRRDRVPA